MPTSDDFDQIAYLIYDENRLYNGKASEFGLPEPYFYVWSGEEYNSGGAYNRYFDTTGTYWSDYSRGYSLSLGLCLGE